MCFICITVIATLFTMITMITHKQLKSIAIALGLTILGLQLGGNTVSALKQEAYHVEKDGTTVENILYIDGFKGQWQTVICYSSFVPGTITQICEAND